MKKTLGVFLGLAFAAATCGAKEFSWRAAWPTNPETAAGVWGISPDTAAIRFRLQSRLPAQETRPERYLTLGLEKYWHAPGAASSFQWVDAGTKTWLVFYQNELFGIVATKSMNDWHDLMDSTYARYGPGETLASKIPDVSTDTPHFLRGTRWKIRGSWMTLFKAENLPPLEWSDPNSGARVHWELVEAPKETDPNDPHAMHRLHNSLDLPLYIGIFDAKTLAAWRRQARESRR